MSHLSRPRAKRNAPTLHSGETLKIRIAEAQTPIRRYGRIGEWGVIVRSWCLHSPIRGPQRNADRSEIVTHGPSIEAYDRSCVSTG